MKLYQALHNLTLNEDIQKISNVYSDRSDSNQM